MNICRYSLSVLQFRRLRPWGVILLITLLITLAGCAKDDMSDLEAFVAKVKARPRPRVEPLPEIRPYETFLYAANELRDPFEPIVESQPPAPEVLEEPEKPISIIHPDFHRNREMLESFPLDSLRMVGTLEQQGTRWGIIKSPDGVVSRVRVGNFMGKNHGRINQITEDRILLTEIIPDGGDGWLEREAAVALSEAELN